MKTNSTFLGVGERGRTTAVMIQNVGHTLLASYRAQQPRLVCISWHETITTLPCNWNEQYFPLSNFPSPLLRIHRSISNEAFLNFPRIPTDRNYPFSPSNKTISLFLSHLTHRAFDFYLSSFPSFLSRPAFSYLFIDSRTATTLFSSGSNRKK